MHGLVEREAVLEVLNGLLRGAGKNGRVALVAGEAGIGKTSVLRALAAGHPEARVWWGACDALETPHPLAPLLDIARQAHPRFATRIDGPRPALFEAVLAELGAAATPTLVVIEDAHWADDATLDLVKFLGRRIERSRALLVERRLGPRGAHGRDALQRARAFGQRGARASTREHPYGLTSRELEVLRLLCGGLRNAEIADRLSRSVRTVDHHVASVLAKLNVDSRAGAVDAARRAGLPTEPGPSQSGRSGAPK